MSFKNSAQPKGPIPGRAGIIMLAAAAVPVIITACKPLAKAVGKGLIAAGEALKKAGEETVEPKKETVASKPSTSAASAPPKVEEAPPVKVASKVKQSKPKKAPEMKASKPAKAKKSAGKPNAVQAPKRRRRTAPEGIETG